MARPKETGRKRKTSDYTSDNGFVENDSDGLGRPTKRTKPAPTSSSYSTSLLLQTDSEGNKFWEISKMRRVTISEFKGRQMISVREYYEQNGEIKPGKKGISMPVDQYSAFVELLPLIEKELAKKGENVPRPHYNEQGEQERDFKEQDESDIGDEDGLPKKSNIEATSDEDED